MKLSGGVEWALHCCVVLSAATEPTPATKLAEFHDVSPSYLAKHLQSLSGAGLIHSTQGKSGGYLLTRPAAEITVLQIVEAIDGTTPAFRCTEVRQRGPLAAAPENCTVPCGIARVMADADRAWRESLNAVTVADLADDVNSTVGPTTLTRVDRWLRTGAP
ncbi:Rrf2 family transcriptional regulator [Pseudonocardia sp. WMMC193]|uniref:RrF2 family transcriptional regulator n=1 Tax=Pseudonocardia sp. WMMC193 TaxID=2911965 RepID=UPI001F2D735D|nr:Rrf2 family transcriptional regulator [Pseudonocardia sp. WMMC193]MCF7547957.1 Rrf2 family transcriptional regulator [Pseudonocardia sp. WMMC193]